MQQQISGVTQWTFETRVRLRSRGAGIRVSLSVWQKKQVETSMSCVIASGKVCAEEISIL